MSVTAVPAIHQQEVKGDAPAPVKAETRRAETRHYIPYDRADTVLEGKPGYIRDLRKTLDKLGLLSQINVEFEKGRVRFHHCRDELLSVLGKHPELIDYFYHLDGNKKRQNIMYLYPQPDQHLHSMAGLVENPKAKIRAINALLELANRRFHTKPAPSPVKFTFNPQAADGEKVKAVYSKFQGLCIGDFHNHVAPLRFLLDNMETLAGCGVKTLFLELFLYDTQQPLLDQYFDNPDPQAEIPFLLKARIESIGWEHARPMFLEILRKAKRLGIRVVGIDTSAAVSIGDKNKEGITDTTQRIMERRAQAMNFVAQQIIEREKGDGRYVAYMGAGHGATQFLHEKDDSSSPVLFKTTGIADLLQCPLITIMDAHDGKKRTKVNQDIPLIQGHVLKHVHLHMLRPKDETAVSSSTKCKAVGKSLIVLAVFGALAASQLLKKRE